MESIGFSNNSEVQDYSKIKDKVLEALKDHFRPEFLNRIDEIVVFDILSQEAIKEIVILKVKIVKNRLLTKGINFEISDDALSYLAKEGYNPLYGARPLNRLIQNKILNSVATYIISNSVKKGDKIFVSIKNEELIIERVKNRPINKIKSPIQIHSHSSV